MEEVKNHHHLDCPPPNHLLLTLRNIIKNSIIHDFTQLPPPAATEEEDVALLGDYPYIESPIRTDYGYNVK